jgi:hypothetical protein
MRGDWAIDWVMGARVWEEGLACEYLLYVLLEK